MNNNYINFYNNLVNLTRNKNLYNEFTKEDTFSDRLLIFLFHFAFFLNVFKSKSLKNPLQNLFDYIFKQLELSIREIGYGDQSINKKMKDYINIFHSMVSEIHFWDTLTRLEKLKKFSIFLSDFNNIEHLLDYFENQSKNLKFFLIYQS